MTMRQPWTYDSQTPHVFVCYSHADRSAVLAEIKSLHDQGFNLWFDESGMHAGSEWPEELAHAIGSCHCFLYFITPSSVATRNCRDELQFARESNKRVVAVYLEETVLAPALALSLSSIHALKKYDLDDLTYRRRLNASLHDEPDEQYTTSFWTPRNKERISWLLGIGLLSVLAIYLYTNIPSGLDNAGQIRFSMPVPEDLDITPPRYEEMQQGSPIAISQSGDVIVFSAKDPSGEYRLYMRELAHTEIKEIPNTQGASAPFLSPDGEYVGFLADRSLKKVSLADGRLQTIVPVLDGEGFGGASWANDDTIIYGPSSVSGLYRVSAAGGAPQLISAPADLSDLTHVAPDILPGGRYVLVSVRSGMLPEPPAVDLLDVETGQRQRLMEGATSPIFANGKLFFGRAGTDTGPIWSVDFDPSRRTLTGEPTKVLDAVASDLYSLGFYDVAEDGSIAFIPPASSRPKDRLYWLDRSGQSTEIVASEDNFMNPTLSPSEDSFLVTLLDDTRQTSVWQYDLTRQILSPIIRDGMAHQTVWLPDATGFVVTANIDGPSNLYFKSLVTNSALERLTDNVNHQDAASLSRDGRYLTFAEIDPDTNWDLWYLDMETRTPHPFLVTPAEEIQPIINPTAPIIAYSSNETGSRQVYVQQFPGGGNKQRISREGGEDPMWSNDGTVLYYRISDQMYQVEIAPETATIRGEPKLLYQGSFEGRTAYGRANWDVTADSSRFIYSSTRTLTLEPKIDVVINR